MKKSISVNIGGIIFHIEEDGYAQLSAFMDKLPQQLDRNDPDTLTEIESRIAEIFLAKLNERKQVITLEDVSQVISVIYKHADFSEKETPSFQQSAVQDEPDFRTEYDRNTASLFETEPEENRILYRDTRHKILGGVCSGLAHYFVADPIWIRLGLLFLFFLTYEFDVIPTVLVLGYVAMWLVVPDNPHLEMDSSIRRFFRDPKEYMIGGVSSGIARYFSIDPTIVRLAFIASAFLGFGLIMYPILWVLMPAAKNQEQLNQWEHQPISFKDLKEKVRVALNLNKEDADKWAGKAVEAPLWMADRTMNFARTNGPVIAKRAMHVIMAFIGAILTLEAFVVSLALATLTGLYFGIQSSSEFSTLLTSDLYFEEAGLRFPLVQTIKETVTPSAVIYGFTSIWIPFLFLGIAGISMMVRRWIAPAYMNWTLLGAWVVGLIGAFITIPMIALEFKADGNFRNEVQYEAPESPIYLTSENLNGNEQQLGTELTIRGHNQADILLVQNFKAKGKSRQVAIENAKNVSYKVLMVDSAMIFDRSIRLEENKPFRGQRLKMDLYLPYEKEFKMSPALAEILSYTLYPAGFSVRDLDNNVFKFTESGLQCISCDDNLAQRATTISSSNDFSNFTRVTADGNVVVKIIHGDEYEVKVESCEIGSHGLQLSADSGELVITKTDDGEEIMPTILITMPDLHSVEAKGASKVYLEEFDLPYLNLSLQDKAKVKARIDVKALNADLKDQSFIWLKGTGNALNIDIFDTSECVATDMIADAVNVEAHGICKAEVYASKALTVRSSFNSNVTYTGNPKHVVVNKLED